MIFKKHNLLSKKDKRKFCFIFSLATFFIFLFLYRVHNSWSFNPYWGYDGGEHIAYLFSLIKNNKIPSILENTVAWHEPLYYFILWPIGKLLYWLSSGSEIFILKSFGVLQAFLSISVSFLIYRIMRLINSSAPQALFLTILISFLPAMNQASTFLTNELLNYFFIFLIIYYFLKYFIYKIPKKRNYIILGLISGLALLTKITALIAIFSILIVLTVQFLKKKKLNFTGIFFFILIIFAINTPWFIYKNNYISQGIGINNTDYLKPQALVLDKRIYFFGKFDTDVFKFPYWYSGGNGFWSMLMADSFYDYYGTIENQDYINYLKDNSPEDLTRITHLPSYVSKDHYLLAKYQVYAAGILSFFLIIGLSGLIIKSLKTKKEEYILYSTLSMGFLAAILYFAYRYPYYDHGIVKSIFIFPLYIFPLWYFFEIIKNKKYLNILIYSFSILYIISIIRYYYIVSFNY